MRILIIGGGVAGSVLAGCLRKRGITDITIVEKAPKFEHMGFLIGLWGNGRTVLRYLGVDQITEKNGYAVGETVMVDQREKPVRTVPLSLFGKFGSTVVISRADLHEGLRTIVSDIDVRFNTTVLDITQEGKKVRVRFSDGTEDSFDLVVGADGIHSQTRERIFGKGFMRYYGWGAWAYWLPPSFRAPKEPTNMLGSAKATLILPSHDRATVTFIAYVPRDTGRGAIDRRAQLRELFKDFQGSIKEALAVAPESGEIWYDDIAHVDMPLWYTGRIALVGDAQHAVSPLVGMGSSMAMEDGYVLAEELERNGEDIDTALRNYARRRDPRMRRLIRVVSRLDGWLRASGARAVFRDKFASYVPDSYFIGGFRKLLESDI